jgi:hypothetical protein
MAELVLNEEEKQAVSLLGEWSDEAIAKAVKYCATILGDEKGNQAVMFQTCGQIMCAISNKMNSANTRLKLKGVTENDQRLGDWVVTVTRVKKGEEG